MDNSDYAISISELYAINNNQIIITDNNKLLLQLLKIYLLISAFSTCCGILLTGIFVCVILVIT